MISKRITHFATGTLVRLRCVTCDGETIHKHMCCIHCQTLKAAKVDVPAWFRRNVEGRRAR